MNAAEPQTRALTRILEQCARLDEEPSSESAALRLRQAVGDDLARLLVTALAGDHRRAVRTV